MATGDAAGSKGLKVYDDSLLGSDVDVALNQRGDDVAAVMTRASALEAAALNVPKFAVNRSTNGQNVPANAWTQMTAGAWGAPVKNVGGFTWSGGNLTVPRAGVYMINSSVQYASDDFYQAGVQVTLNSTKADANYVTKGEWWSTPQNAFNTNPTATALTLMQPLNAGDVLRFWTIHKNNNNNTRNTVGNSNGLRFQVQWVDQL